MKPVGELDQDDPDVSGHRDHHLAVVLRLTFVAALEGDLGQLGDAVDQTGDRRAELLLDLFETGRSVLDRVMEQRRAERLGVEVHAHADPGDPDRMGDEFVTRLPLLVLVVAAGEDEGLGDLLAVDRHIVHRAHGGEVRFELLDHRHQVIEQGTLAGGQPGSVRPGP